MKPGKLRIVEMKLSELTPAPYNPRTISEAAMRGLQASIERYGLVEPIVWNERTGFVVGGNQRLAVLRQLGTETVAVVVVDLDNAEERALNLALNNPGIAGQFTAQARDIIAELRGGSERDGRDQDWDAKPPYAARARELEEVGTRRGSALRAAGRQILYQGEPAS